MGSNNSGAMALLMIGAILFGTAGGYFLTAFLPAQDTFGFGSGTVTQDQDGKLLNTYRIDANSGDIRNSDSDNSTHIIPGLSKTISISSGSKIAVFVNFNYMISLFDPFSGYALYHTAIAINA